MTEEETWELALEAIRRYRATGEPSAADEGARSVMALAQFDKDTHCDMSSASSRSWAGISSDRPSSPPQSCWKICASSRARCVRSRI